MLEAVLESGFQWTADEVAEATQGTWIVPPQAGWSATGLCKWAPTMQPGNMVVLRAEEQAGGGVSLRALLKMEPPPACVITSEPEALSLTDLPILRVADTGEAILALGRYARRQLTGKVLAITGSAGKTTTVAMLSRALAAWGDVAQTIQNANLPHGVAWNLASIPRNAPHVVLELAIGRMGTSARMAQPHIAIFTNVLPAHLKEGDTLKDIAATKSAIFSGMSPGGVAILNRDMLEWETVNAAAEARGLQIVHYGATEGSQFRFLGYDTPEKRVHARIGKQELRYRLGAAGPHMALNSLAVLAAVNALGLPLEPALAQLEGFSALSGRGEELEITLNGRRLRVLDDAYNANPGSMAAALEHLGRKVSGRRIAVLGEMAELGPQAERHHSDMAHLCERLAIDRFYLAGGLYKGFWERLPAFRRGRLATSLDELKAVLLEELADGDVVLFKGSHSTGMHQLVDWLKERGKEGAPASAPGADIPATNPWLPHNVSALLYDGGKEAVVFTHRALEPHPPASIAKLFTLCLIEERLQALGLPRDTPVEISQGAAKVNSWWGFPAGQQVSIETLMRATAIVSSNEAANALAEWHSGSIEAFTVLLNNRAADLGMTNTRFATPSGLGRQQWTNVNDVLILSRFVLAQHSVIAAMCAERSFSWNGKKQASTNRLLAQIEGADGLKTGTLVGRGNHIAFSALRGGRRWIAVVLGASTKVERDDAVKALMARFATGPS